jgi:hypothetical protein
MSMEHESRYHLRERVDQTLNEWVGSSPHPLTQVVPTSLRSNPQTEKFVAHLNCQKDFLG